MCDDSAAVHGPRAELEDGCYGFRLRDPAVADRRGLVGSRGHKAPLEHALAALVVALVKGGREALAREPAVQLQICGELRLPRDVGDGRHQHVDRCGVGVASLEVLKIPRRRRASQDSVVRVELRGRYAGSVTTR